MFWGERQHDRFPQLHFAHRETAAPLGKHLKQPNDLRTSSAEDDAPMATEHAQALSTSFDAEAKAHEEVIDVLQAYQESLGKLLSDDDATIDHSAGDASMVFLNHPLPCDRLRNDGYRRLGAQVRLHR